MKMNSTRPFGLDLSSDSARDIVQAALHPPTDDSVALVVTPNIEHIAMIRRSPALAAAYRNAARIVCDGWPVQLYARLCGLRVALVTGCEITSELMQLASRTTGQKFFFVVDTAETERALTAWAGRNSVASMAAIPPFGFENDPDYCQRLAESIGAHGTTILMMAVGAPRSEVFVDSHRAILPPCWAFCVGQAVKVELGLVQRASLTWRSAGMEWLWRLRQEPARLTKRYVTAAIGFGFAVIEDQLRQLREGRS